MSAASALTVTVRALASHPCSVLSPLIWTLALVTFSAVFWAQQGLLNTRSGKATQAHRVVVFMVGSSGEHKHGSGLS